MRVHMFGSRPRVVLTLYLKLGLNSTLDVAVRVWHFRQGHIHTPFTSLCSGAEAKNNLRMLQWSCFTIKPLLSLGLLLLPNWLQDLLTYFIGCFDSVGAKILPAASQGFSCYRWVPVLLSNGATKSDTQFVAGWLVWCASMMRWSIKHQWLVVSSVLFS